MFYGGLRQHRKYNDLFRTAKFFFTLTFAVTSKHFKARYANYRVRLTRSNHAAIAVRIPIKWTQFSWNRFSRSNFMKKTPFLHFLTGYVSSICRLISSKHLDSESGHHVEQIASDHLTMKSTVKIWWNKFHVCTCGRSVYYSEVILFFLQQSYVRFFEPQDVSQFERENFLLVILKICQCRFWLGFS